MTTWKTSRRKIFYVRHVTELICPKLCPDLDRRKVNFGCYGLHRRSGHRTATRNFILVNLTLGRTRKFIPPPWYKRGGGVDGTPPQSYVAVFRNDFTFGEKPLIFSTRWGTVYFMDGGPLGGPTGGLWRHSQWSPSWLPSWILLRIRNQGKTARNGNFLCLTCKVTHE